MTLDEIIMCKNTPDRDSIIVLIDSCLMLKVFYKQIVRLNRSCDCYYLSYFFMRGSLSFSNCL